jgi:hypothetical protein
LLVDDETEYGGLLFDEEPDEEVEFVDDEDESFFR